MSLSFFKNSLANENILYETLCIELNDFLKKKTF